MNPWAQVKSTDLSLRALADRHYSRQTPGAAGFSQNCRRVAFVVPGGRREWVATIRGGVLRAAVQVVVAQAGWVTSWPLPQYAGHAWADSWVNTFFRNESPLLASELIVTAVQATLTAWPEPPAGGLVTFIDPAKVQRDRKGVGRTYRLAGFENVGRTKKGLEVFQLSQSAILHLVPARTVALDEV